MKLTKKLLAMALAGVMLLTILTGCSGGKTGDRLVEEYMAAILRENPASGVSGDIPITHDVPEIKDVAENFDPSMLAPNGIGFDSSKNLDSLKSALANYSSANFFLYAMAVPEGMSELTQVTLLRHHSFPYIHSSGSITFSSIKCASTLVKKGGKQYRLVVLIQVPAAS